MCTDLKKENEITNPVLDIVKQSIGTKIFICAATAFTAAVVLNLVNYLFVNSELWYDFGITEAFQRIAINAELISIPGLSLFPKILGRILSAIISPIPSIMLAIGMWITYFSFKKMTEYNEKNAGIKIIRIVLIAFMVFSLIALARNIFLFVIVGALVTESATYIVLGVCLAFSMIISLMFFYYFKLFELMGYIKTILKTGVVEKKVPRFVGFSTMIFAAVSVVSTLYVASMTFMWSNDGIFAAFLNLVSALGSILFGVSLLSFGEKINDLLKKQNKSSLD